MVRFVQTLGQSTSAPRFVAVYLSNMATEDEQRKFWREFIGVYSDLPDVWKVKSEVVVVLSILILHYNMYYFHFTLQEQQLK